MSKKQLAYEKRLAAEVRGRAVGGEVASYLRRRKPNPEDHDQAWTA